MSNQVFTIAKGSIAKLAALNPNKFQVLLLKANEAQAELIKHDNVAALLAAPGNTEADFTNYARKIDLTGTLVIDDVLDEVRITLDNQTFVNAGGATNNTLTKLLVCYSTGAGDENLIPLTHHDYPEVTTGGAITPLFDANGFWKSS